MDLVRIAINAPGEAGPTGPSLALALSVPTGGTHLNLNEPALSSLKNAIDKGFPLMMAAEGAPNVYYRFSSVGSGGAADPAMTVVGPTAANQAAILFGNTRTPLPEQALAGNGLVIRAAGAVGTSTLRIWNTGK